jgi:hypothetical protein
MIVHSAFATLLARTGGYGGTFGKMTLSPIAKSLHDLIQSPAPEIARTSALSQLETRAGCSF